MGTRSPKTVPPRSPFGVAVERENSPVLAWRRSMPEAFETDAERWAREADAEVEALCPVLRDPEVERAVVAHREMLQQRETWWGHLRRVAWVVVGMDAAASVAAFVLHNPPVAGVVLVAGLVVMAEDVGALFRRGA